MPLAYQDRLDLEGREVHLDHLDPLDYQDPLGQLASRAPEVNQEKGEHQVNQVRFPFL